MITDKRRKRRSAAALLCIILAVAVTAAAFPAALALPAGGRVYSGIDVSEFQGDIDFSAVKSSGVEMVYIRAGFGRDGTDAYFERNYSGASAAGLMVGFYYYVAAANEEEAREQARFFASLADGKSYDGRLVMDFEEFGDLSVSEINSVAYAFITELEQASRRGAAIYSDLDNARDVFDGRFAEYPLWIAEYGADEPGDPGKWSSWAGFQYSDVGSVSGISGNVDLDKFTDGMLLDEGGGAENGGIQYTVRRDDTLWAIARRYGVSVSAIVRANGISNPDLIYTGDVLNIPSAARPVGRRYTVRRGDTLWAIARRYGVSITAIVRANGISNPDLIYPGDVLNIPSAAPPGCRRYTVRRDDTLWAIARRYGVSVSAIVRANGISNPDLIYPGQMLIIP